MDTQANMRVSCIKVDTPALSVGMYAHKVTAWNTAAAAVLYELKEEVGVTYEHLVEPTGLSVISLKRKLKPGNRPSPITLEEFAVIARVLGRDPMDLFNAVETRVQGDQ